MVERPLQFRNRNDFRIAIICALPLEAGMVRCIFDEEKSNDFRRAQGDGNAYSIGVIGKHNVVLVHMPGMGNVDAATAAGYLRTTFSGIAIVFIVGICGASPQDSTAKENIFLGDFIVSTALVQYDFGRQYPGQFSTKSEVEEALGRANPMVRAFLAKLQTPQSSNSLEKRLALHLGTLQQKEPNALYPGPYRDRLFDATHLHTHHDATTCNKCTKEIGVCTKECDEIGCQQERSLIRARSTIQRESEAEYLPRLHFGRYGSANTVMMSGANRDELAKKKIIAFEMEGAGFWENMPTLILKSACDYADSHKSKEWQNYAAATAAAGLKAILEEWEVNDGLLSQADNYDISFSLDGVPLAKVFVDRPREMQRLETILLPNDQSNRRRKLFVLRGLGGIGKTQLAVEFMRKNRTNFTAVFWLDGSSEDSLKQSIAKLASRIPSGQISDQSRMYTSTGDGDIANVIKEVMTWLELPYNNRWLMVFDNVDREFVALDPEPLSYDVKKYIPGADHGSILITTRLAQLERLGKSQEVKKVDNATAKAILGSWHDDDSEDLLERLDGLPLALAQAGSYLHQTGISIDTYLRLYDEQNERVAEAIHKSDILDDYPNHSVWTTWNVSYDAVLAKDKCAANLLILWSYLDRNDLWYDLFKKASTTDTLAEALFHRLGDIAGQELSFIEAMSLLRSYSLIEGSSQGYMMHTVMHRWVYFHHGMKHRSVLGLLALKVIGFAVPAASERDYAQLQQRLLPHANMCLMRVVETEKSQHQGDNKMFGSQVSYKELKDCLDAIRKLGILYWYQSKFDEAERMYMRALRGYEALGSEHTSTLQTANNLGLLYWTRERLDEAEKMYIRALQGYEALELENIHTFHTFNNLGLTYLDQGKLNEAEKMYLRALQGYEALGLEKIHTLEPVNNLGLTYLDQGKLDEAEKMLLRALEGYEEAFGPKHTAVFSVVNDLGRLYCDQGRLDESEKMLLRALEGIEGEFGSKHRYTLDTISNLGRVYSNQDKLGEAEMMFLRALRSFEETFGTELRHVPALKTMKGLGDLYSKTRPDEARAMYERALAGYTKARGASADICLTINQSLEALKVPPKPK